MMETIFICFGRLNKDTKIISWVKKCIYINEYLFLLLIWASRFFNDFSFFWIWLVSPNELFSALRWVIPFESFPFLIFRFSKKFLIVCLIGLKRKSISYLAAQNIFSHHPIYFQTNSDDIVFPFSVWSLIFCETFVFASLIGCLWIFVLSQS